MGLAVVGVALAGMAAVCLMLGFPHQHRVLLSIAIVSGFAAVVVTLSAYRDLGPIPAVLAAVLAASAIWRWPPAIVLPNKPIHLCSGGCGEWIYGGSEEQCAPCDLRRRDLLAEVEGCRPLIRWP